MKSKTLKFIIFAVIGVATIIVIGVVLNKPRASVNDSFAQCIADSGAKFYGAFWCPHCQAQKKLFGSAKQYLPYIECSSPNQEQYAVCNDAKVEGYPTWMFAKGITIESETKPTICEVAPGVPGQDSICQQVASEFDRTWVFRDRVVKSSTEPIQNGNQWIFPPEAQTTGELSFDFLSAQTSCVPPQE